MLLGQNIQQSGVPSGVFQQQVVYAQQPAAVVHGQPLPTNAGGVYYGQQPTSAQVYPEPGQHGQAVYAQPQAAQATPAQIVGQTVLAYPQIVGAVQSSGFTGVPQATVLGGMEGLRAILLAYPYIKVIQKFTWLEAVSQGCFEVPNTYTVWGGASVDQATQHILTATENSKGCTRCCCAPMHSSFIHIIHPQTRQVFVTLERPGVECCLDGNCLGPKPCLCCFAFNESCSDAIYLHEGYIRGAVGNNGKGIASVVQDTNCGGGCTPTLYINDGAARNGVIQGPTIFGGCLELCCDTTFYYTSNGGKINGDVRGRIVHLHPQCCSMDCFTEMCTDSDKFGIEMSDALSGDDKVKALAAMLLIDYMSLRPMQRVLFESVICLVLLIYPLLYRFFELDNGMLTCKPARRPKTGCTIHITFCEHSVLHFASRVPTFVKSHCRPLLLLWLPLPCANVHPVRV